jgi:reverse gyrase
MKLLIVESPAKAKTISKYLEGKYHVMASVGHVRDLPKSNKDAIDIEGGFVPRYEISKGKEKVVKEIRDFSKKSDEILLATDPDREGEAIAWHLAQIIGDDSLKSKVKSKNSKIKRVTYPKHQKRGKDQPNRFASKNRPSPGGKKPFQADGGNSDGAKGKKIPGVGKGRKKSDPESPVGQGVRQPVGGQRQKEKTEETSARNPGATLEGDR